MITKLDIFKTDSFLNDDKAIIVNYPSRHEDDDVLNHFLNECRNVFIKIYIFIFF